MDTDKPLMERVLTDLKNALHESGDTSTEGVGFDADDLPQTWRFTAHAYGLDGEVARVVHLALSLDPDDPIGLRAEEDVKEAATTPAPHDLHYVRLDIMRLLLSDARIELRPGNDHAGVELAQDLIAVADALYEWVRDGKHDA